MKKLLEKKQINRLMLIKEEKKWDIAHEFALEECERQSTLEDSDEVKNHFINMGEEYFKNCAGRKVFGDYGFYYIQALTYSEVEK
jgi:hypothetical protein